MILRTSYICLWCCAILARYLVQYLSLTASHRHLRAVWTLVCIPELLLPSNDLWDCSGQLPVSICTKLHFATESHDCQSWQLQFSGRELVTLTPATMTEVEAILAAKQLRPISEPQYVDTNSAR